MNILQEFDTEELYIRYAIDEKPDDRHFTMHIHERCEIFYFVSGHVEYLVEGSKYPLTPGDMMIMRPSESHRTKILGNNRYERYAINFSPTIFEHIDPQRRLLSAFFDRPLGYGNFYASSEFYNIPVKDIFHSMCYCNDDDYGKRLNIMTHLLRLLDVITQTCAQRKSDKNTAPKSLSGQIVSYVNMHLFEALSVPELAETFYLSASQFGRIFRQATGASPWEYIIAKRLTAAREKIRSGFSAQSAGESCGFGDYSAFYRSYVKYFGHSPKKEIMQRLPFQEPQKPFWSTVKPP